jgi:hypothetical protein
MGGQDCGRAETKTVVERWNEQLASLSGNAVVADPGSAARTGAPARGVLPGMWDQPRPGSAHSRSPSTRLGRHAGAWAALLMVSGRGAEATPCQGAEDHPPTKRRAEAPGGAPIPSIAQALLLAYCQVISDGRNLAGGPASKQRKRLFAAGCQARLRTSLGSRLSSSFSSRAT